MTQKDFVDTFAARRMAYRASVGDVRKAYRERMRALRFNERQQLMIIKRDYHAGNAALEQLRQATITANPAKRQKQDCYNIQRCLGKQLQAFASDYLNTTEATCKFNREEDKVVFTIEVPYCLTSKNANDHDNQ